MLHARKEYESSKSWARGSQYLPRGIQIGTNQMGPLVKEGFIGLGRHDMNHVYHMLDYETRCPLTPLSCLFLVTKMGSTANKGNLKKFENEIVTALHWGMLMLNLKEI